MATSIDALQIEINARATSANNAINRLTKNLDKLSTSLNSLNVGNVKGLDKTLKSLANISNISSNGATNITNLARALATLSANANNIPVLNHSLSGLSGSLARFMATMSVAPSVNSNTLQMTQALAQLSRAGNNASVTASNLANLGTQLRNFMQIMSTAPMVNQNTIQMTNALANLASQGSRVGKSSKSLVSGLNRTDKAMRTSTKSAWSLARAFGKFYANYFLIIRGAKALWGSIESTADYIESFNYYTVAFGKIASEWKQDFARFGYDNAEEYADSFVGRMNETLGKLSGVQISVDADGKGLLTDTGMKNLGLNIQEITQYASQLASVTNSLGQTGETSLAISQSFTKLAGDISSLFNVDYSTVSKNLQSGLIGQSRALYKYGIDITNATLQTKAYELGLSKAVSEMTQAEKMQLRTLVILEQSKVSWGDLANTINSPSNMIRQLTTNLKEAGMVLGQLFIPMLEHVLPVVNGATIALKRLLTEIAGFFGVEIDFEKFGQGYNELEEDNSDLSGSYDDLANSIEEVKSQLLGFDEVNKLSDTSATLSVGTEDNTIDLTDEIVSATKEYQKVWDEAFANMENTSQKWANTIGNAFDTLADYLEPITDFSSENLENFYDSFLKPLGSWTLGTGLPQLADIFDDFMDDVDWDDLADDLNKFYKGVEPFAVGIGQGLLDFLNGLAEIGAGAINLLGDALGVLGEAFQVLGEKNMEDIGEFFGTLVPLLITLNAATKVPSIISGVATSLSNFAHSGKGTLSIWVTELGALAGIWDYIIGQTEGGKIKEGAEEIKESIEDTIEKADQSIADVDAAHEHFSTMATKYAELSANYSTLTDDEKTLLKEYYDELVDYAPEIATKVDSVTKAWAGTTTELQNAIDKQAEFYKQSAIENAKQQVYSVIVEAEVGRQETYGALVKWEKTLYNELQKSKGGKDWLQKQGLTGDRAVGELAIAYQDFKQALPMIDFGISSDTTVNISKLVSALKTYNKTLDEANKKIELYDNALESYKEELTEPSGNINLGGIGIGAIFSDDTSEAFEDYFDNLDKAKNESHLTVDTSGVREGCDNATNKVKFFNTEANRNSTVTLRVNKVDFIESLNGASALYSGTVGRMNNSLIIPSLSTSTYNTQVSAVVSEYLKKRKEIEDKKIGPTVATESATRSFSSIRDNFFNTLGGLTSTIEFEADKEALKKLTSDFQNAVLSMGGTLPGAISGINFGNKLGIKKFASGGFVDEGQLFIAREAGPELVGSMGGHTAVANNQQITDGIARGVYSALISALSTTNHGSSGDIIVNIDGKQVFKAVQKQATNYVAQTGQTPFPI